MWSAKWTKEQLEKLGARPDKRLGQHFLIDRTIAERQITYADLSEKDVVLEIGPGLGAITKLLAREAGAVNVIERDPEFAAFLESEMPVNVSVVEGDAVTAPLPEFNKVVANLPYEISSPITFRLLERDFDLAILMYQKEFAERMVAGPGSKRYSRLSVNARYRADCELLESVPPSAFWPRPKVSSAIMRITPRPPPLKVCDEELFFKVVEALFKHRRKKIRNGLEMNARALGIKSIDLRDVPHGDARVETLGLDEINEIVDFLLEY